MACAVHILDRSLGKPRQTVEVEQQGRTLEQMLMEIAAEREAKQAQILRKTSAHGLGDKRAPYDDDHAPTSIPNPIVKLSDIGVDRWQHDLWHQIIKAALVDRFDVVPLDYHPALQLPAMSRYAATTPDILNWFKTYNADRPYALQVKPFNFCRRFKRRLAPTCPSSVRSSRPRKRDGEKARNKHCGQLPRTTAIQLRRRTYALTAKRGSQYRRIV
jgi:hypothetical protein